MQYLGLGLDWVSRPTLHAQSLPRKLSVEARSKSINQTTQRLGLNQGTPYTGDSFACFTHAENELGYHIYDGRNCIISCICIGLFQIILIYNILNFLLKNGR